MKTTSEVLEETLRALLSEWMYQLKVASRANDRERIEMLAKNIDKITLLIQAGEGESHDEVPKEDD